MSATLVRIVTVLTFATALPIAATRPTSAQSASKASATVAGKWTMSVEGSPHGNLTLGLTLKQEGTHVTGTFASPHGDMPVDGEFSDRVLKLSTTGGNADSQITFEAKLKDDDSLEGYLSSGMGDMAWTARRVRETK